MERGGLNRQEMVLKQTARYRLPFFYVVIAALAFGAMAVLAIRVDYFPGDVEITRVVQSFRSPPLDVLMTLVTLAGSPPQTLVLNVLFVLITLLFRMKAEAITLLVFIPMFGGTL